ncbi:hypothetical protein KPH14_009556 [Odynerus spinipes]|uniref:Uncharacterized protein n=1 Tax=Odynerus spinipes TaxID=1348599 RepID=A0AAD9RPY2_9HYME|nr:hypothetical protein KPH14_009556 [Odynerus spinipes]
MTVGCVKSLLMRYLIQLDITFDPKPTEMNSTQSSGFGMHRDRKKLNFTKILRKRGSRLRLEDKNELGERRKSDAGRISHTI